ncbi:outer membrane protein [Sphingomonas mucosissima]|uniref:Surface antigen n=1 Tax=Sphingomonas mucosissima TaxID=370959 RepID=A0A245ZJI0_9SPHN|nr:outer membrane beta-barrel protein [Sphingomonas mucosissima]OWK29898.1 surface antigen [Sphingomonas mucosissima]
MRGIIVHAAVLLAAGLIAAPAVAQDNNRGAYAELSVGLARVHDNDIGYFDEGGTFGGSGARDTAWFEADLQNSATFGGALGYDFGIVRADLRVDYARSKIRSLTVKSVNGSPLTLTPADGADICAYLEVDDCSVSGNTISADGSRARQLSALANLWVDIPTGSAITPYVGGGAGIGGYEVDGEGKARFAWQLGAGVSFDLSPSVALFGDYRFRQIQGATIAYDDFPDAGVIVGKVKTSTFNLGVRFRF